METKSKYWLKDQKGSTISEPYEIKKFKAAGTRKKYEKNNLFDEWPCLFIFSVHDFSFSSEIRSSFSNLFRVRKSCKRHAKGCKKEPCLRPFRPVPVTDRALEFQSLRLLKRCNFL